MQNFKSFNVKLRGENAYPSGIAAGPRQAGHEGAANHVVGHGDDWDRLRRALRGSDGGVAEGDNEIDVLRDKFASQRRRTLAEPFGPNEQEADVASLFPADRLHVAPERLGECFEDVLVIGPQYTDHGEPALLRACRERPHTYRAAEQRDEIAAPHHSITSSARASSVGGTVRPSALAVVRFTT